MNRDRLNRADQFTRVFSQATSSGSKVFTVLCRENEVKRPRLGVIVAKRHAKRSVDRNRIKRMIRESFRLNKYALPGSDFIVILKRPVSMRTDSSLGLQLQTLWKRYRL